MSDTAEAIAQARKAVEPDKPKHVLRTLGHSIREYKKASILAPVFVAVEGILEILIPTIMASLIDEGITGGSMPATVKFGVILLVCAMVSLGAGFLSGKYAAVAGAGFAKNLRKDQFEKVQGFSFTNIDRFSTGSIVTRLTTDVTNLQNAYMMIIRLGVRAPIMVVVSWLFSFRISPSISMVFLACIPILAIGLCGLAVLVHPVFERVFHTYDALNNVVDENLQGIRVVKSYNRESFEVSKFGRISQRIFKDDDPHRMDGRAADRRLRQQPRRGPDHRRPDRTGHLRHADPYGHDDAVHDLRHGDYFSGFCRAYLPGAAGGKHGAEPGTAGD